MKRYRASVILSGITTVLALTGFTLYAVVGILMDEWNFGWIGIYVAMLSMGAGNLYAATSTRTGAEQYNDLSNKLNTIASQQKELLWLVQSRSKHSQVEDPTPDSSTNSAEPSEDPADS